MLHRTGIRRRVGTNPAGDSSNGTAIELRDLEMEMGDPNRSESQALGTAPGQELGDPFFVGMVHELRNGLFGITASLDAFEGRFGGEGGAQKYSAALRKSLGRLNAFVDELRDYGDPSPGAQSELDPETLLQEAREERQARGGRPVELHLPEAVPLPRIRGDGPSLRALLLQFMDLACLRENPRPVLELRPHEADGRRFLLGRLELPWAEEEPGRVFEPFHLRLEGMGRLVLPLSQRRIEAHGGNLRAEARTGGGMTIIFTIPAI